MSSTNILVYGDSRLTSHISPCISTVNKKGVRSDSPDSSRTPTSFSTCTSYFRCTAPHLTYFFLPLQTQLYDTTGLLSTPCHWLINVFNTVVVDLVTQCLNTEGEGLPSFCSVWIQNSVGCSWGVLWAAPFTTVEWTAYWIPKTMVWFRSWLWTC